MNDRFPEVTKSVEAINNQRLRKVASYLGSTVLFASPALYLSAGAMNHFAFDKDRPLHPTTVTEYYTNAYELLAGVDTCPPPLRPEDIDNIFTEEQTHWPKDQASLEEFASYHDLTIADQRHARKTELMIKKASSHDEITSLASKFTLKEFGFSVLIDGFDERPDQLPSVEYLAQKSQRLIQILSILPKESLEVINIDRLEIRPLNEERQQTHNESAAGTYLHSHGSPVISVDYQHVDHLGTLLHEIYGHGMHAAACNGLKTSFFEDGMKDETITRYNHKSYRYLNDRGLQYDEANEADYQSDYFVSAYAETNVKEDVAKITEAILLGDIELTPSLQKKPLGRKAATVVHRINELAPGSVDYLVAALSTVR